MICNSYRERARGEDLPVSIHWKHGKAKCMDTINLNAALVYID